MVGSAGGSGALSRMAFKAAWTASANCFRRFASREAPIVSRACTTNTIDEIVTCPEELLCAREECDTRPGWGFTDVGAFREEVRVGVDGVFGVSPTLLRRSVESDGRSILIGSGIPPCNDLLELLVDAGVCRPSSCEISSWCATAPD